MFLEAFMELKDFIGKVVRNTKTGDAFTLTDITSPEIRVASVRADADGHHTFYVYRTINGDPFSNGVLVFETPALTEAFKQVFGAYQRSRDAYWEEYGYWMRRD
jgi:hypothetical protein